MNDLATKEFICALIYQIAEGLGNPKYLEPLKTAGLSDSALVYLLLQNKATKGELRHASLSWLKHQHKMPTPGDLLMLIEAQRAGQLKHLCAQAA